MTKTIMLTLFLVAVLVTGVLAINIVSSEVYASGQGNGNDNGKGKSGHGEKGCETATAASEGKTKNPHCDDDGDGVSNANDICPGFDDNADADGDGIPDGCELDTDGDGVIDDLDVCPGFDDNADVDGDGTPDGCDLDIDGDGFPNIQENTLGTDPNDPADFPGCGGINTIDTCIDGDGITTPLRGAFSAVWGDPLTAWPTGFYIAGIDWFDTDGSNSWTLGDDIHLERTGFCPTGISNAVHVFGSDCILLDLDASLAGGETVNCDLESGTFCSAAMLTELGTTGIKFTDLEVLANGFYDNTEDIIKDNNGNGIFD